MTTQEYLRIYQDLEAAGELPKGRNLRALKRLAGLRPTPKASRDRRGDYYTQADLTDGVVYL